MSEDAKDLSLAERAKLALQQNEDLKNARGLAEEAEKLTAKIKRYYQNARQASKIFNAAAQGVETALDYAMPVLKPVYKIAGWLGAAFKYAAFERDGKNFKRDADGDLIFSPGRLARSFALAACLGLSGVAGMHYAYYNATKFSETIYVTGKQEIRDGELYHVTGCTSLPCATQSDTGKYYQITKSYFAPRLIYPEEDVYANVPNQMAACHINGYGIYFKELKPVFKWAQWYQNIENVSCRPLSQEEVQLSMQQPAP
jgi:hypothetical protein